MHSRIATAVTLALCASLPFFAGVGSATAADELVASAPLEGGGLVAVAVKVTRLTGQLELGHDPDFLADRALAAILQGFALLRPDTDARPGPDDHIFYMDFHPHRSEQGELFLTSALFSEFDCVTPLYRRDRDPCSGRWEDLSDVFASAARDLEAEMWQAISAGPAAGGECSIDAAPPTTASTAAGTDDGAL